MSDADGSMNRFLPDWLGGGGDGAVGRAGGGNEGADGLLVRMEQLGRGVRRAAPSIPDAYGEQVEAALEATGRLVSTARARAVDTGKGRQAPSLDGAVGILQRLHFQLVRLRIRHDELGEDAAREAAAELEATVAEAREMAASLNGGGEAASRR